MAKPFQFSMGQLFAVVTWVGVIAWSITTLRRFKFEEPIDGFTFGMACGTLCFGWLFAYIRLEAALGRPLLAAIIALLLLCLGAGLLCAISTG